MSIRSDTKIILHYETVTRECRNQQNNHQSVIIWFTGLSSSGKSTLAHAVEEKLYQQGSRTFVLDGDKISHGLSSNLGFSEQGPQKISAASEKPQN